MNNISKMADESEHINPNEMDEEKIKLFRKKAIAVIGIRDTLDNCFGESTEHLILAIMAGFEDIYKMAIKDNDSKR